MGSFEFIPRGFFIWSSILRFLLFNNDPEGLKAPPQPFPPVNADPPPPPLPLVHARLVQPDLSVFAAARLTLG